MGNLLSRTPEQIHPSNEASYRLCGVQFFRLAHLHQKPLCPSRWFTKREATMLRELTPGACKLRRLSEHPEERMHCPRCNKVFFLRGTPAWENNKHFPTYEGPWYTKEKKLENGGLVSLSLQVEGR